jgi:hypothetical protein
MNARYVEDLLLSKALQNTSPVRVPPSGWLFFLEIMEMLKLL